MRREVRADIAVWLAMAVTAALIIGLLRPPHFSPDDIGLTGWRTTVVLPLAVAALVACAVIAGRRWLESRAWPMLQLLSLIAATAWTAPLIAARHSAYDGAEVGTYAGNAISQALHRLASVAPWAPDVVIGLGSGLAVVLLNSAVHSLSGHVQAARLAPAIVLSPGATLLADGMTVSALVAVCGVLALSALASERGRGLLWSTALALLSGVLLFAGALTGFAATAAGLGMLCIYFLRRRSLMIVVAGLGVLASLLSAAAIGWSWPRNFGEASALKLADPASLAVSVVLGALAIIALGGPTHRESWRKVRGTPSWPLMLTGLVAAFLAVLTRPSSLDLIPAAAVWLPLLTVAASAPPKAAGTPDGPAPLGLVLSASVAIVFAAL